MTESVTPIVIVAFNRPLSLRRLLKSVASAHYPNADIPLIISIDKGPDNEDVREIAEQFNWTHGSKKVIYQDTNLGLRKHILQSASTAVESGSVIILEDDLFVSPNYYQFTTQALEFSQDKDYIGGISLYNHRLNVNTSLDFEPIEDGYDNWYFQFASSWGQAWTKDQFRQFLNWYEEGPSIDDDSNLPRFVRDWSEKSWLKYFIAYLVETDKYFLYPRASMSTNFSDKGTHVGSDSTDYQVPLLHAKQAIFRFSKIEESGSVYDVFYENSSIPQILGIKSEDITVDLYGYRGSSETRYFLSPRKLDYEVIQGFGRSLRPHDANIICGLKGNDIFLYDTSKHMTASSGPDRMRRILYQTKSIPLPDLLFYTKAEIKAKIGRLIRRLLP